MDRVKRIAEYRTAEPCQKDTLRGVVRITPAEMIRTCEKVELVAKISVIRPSGDKNYDLDGRQEKRDRDGFL